MKAVIDSKEFKRVIKALKPFTRLDTEKMQYIHLEVNNGEIRFEALDGHRIAVEYIKCVAGESFNTYIKPFTVFKTNSDTVEIELINDKCSVTMGDYTIRFSQPVGEWYETKKMIEELEIEEPMLKVGIDAKLLMDALKNVKDKHGRDIVAIECRSKKSPVIIRDIDDKRNIRLVLPLNINE